MKRLKRFLKRNKNKFKYIIAFLLFLFMMKVLYEAYKMGILTDQEVIKDFLGDWAFLAPLIFVALRVIVTFIPFLPNMIFIIIGFTMFGGLKGIIYNYIASTLAAFVDYFLVKIFGTKVLTRTFSEGKIKKYKKQIDQSQKKFNKFLFIMNSVPFAPSNFFCMIAPLTSITTKKYLYIVVTSKIPETLSIWIILNYFRPLLSSFM